MPLVLYILPLGNNNCYYLFQRNNMTARHGDILLITIIISGIIFNFFRASPQKAYLYRLSQCFGPQLLSVNRLMLHTSILLKGSHLGEWVIRNWVTEQKKKVRTYFCDLLIQNFPNSEEICETLTAKKKLNAHIIFPMSFVLTN